MSTTQHPGLTPEQNTWLMQNVSRAEEELLWRDVFARLHRLETASKPATPEADRPEWWHRLNAASPEIAARAARAVEQRQEGEGWDAQCFDSAFLWGSTPEKAAFWCHVADFLTGRRAYLPPLPAENDPPAKADASGKLEFQDTREGWKALAAVSREQLREQEAELTRLRAEVERLTKERDEACEQGRQEGHKEAREGIAGLLESQAEHYRRNAADPAMLRKEFNEWAHDFCRAIARNARNWQPAQEGGAK